MWIVKWFAEFIGRVLKHILPTLINEAKKPKKVKMVGGSDEAIDAVHDSIADRASGLHLEDKSSKTS